MDHVELLPKLANAGGYASVDASLNIGSEWGPYSVNTYMSIYCTLAGGFILEYGPGGGAVQAVNMSCTPASLPRGSSIQATLQGASGNVTWSFSGGGGSVGPVGGSNTWSGIMVTGGTRVIVKSGV